MNYNTLLGLIDVKQYYGSAGTANRDIWLNGRNFSDGWGLWLTFGSPGAQRRWYALANILERRQLPDDDSTSTEPMLLVRYYEGSPGGFSTMPAPSDWSHREDYYVSTAGVTRIEGRQFGLPAGDATCLHWSCQKRQLTNDADAFHHPVLTGPNYCMTAASAGDCLVRYNGGGREKWPVLYQ